MNKNLSRGQIDEFLMRCENGVNIIGLFPFDNLFVDSIDIIEGLNTESMEEAHYINTLKSSIEINYRNYGHVILEML